MVYKGWGIPWKFFYIMVHRNMYFHNATVPHSVQKRMATAEQMLAIVWYKEWK